MRYSENSRLSVYRTWAELEVLANVWCHVDYSFGVQFVHSAFSMYTKPFLLLYTLHWARLASVMSMKPRQFIINNGLTKHPEPPGNCGSLPRPTCSAWWLCQYQNDFHKLGKLCLSNTLCSLMWPQKCCANFFVAQWLFRVRYIMNLRCKGTNTLVVLIGGHEHERGGVSWRDSSQLLQIIV